RLLVDGLPGLWLRHPGFEAEPAGSPVYPSFLFRQVQVIPGATDVELAGGNGGMLSTVSRRGVSKFRFEPFAFWSGKLGIPKLDNAGDSSVTSFQAGATVSGVLVPEKATYLVGFSYEESEIPSARPWDGDSGSFGGAAVPLVQTLETVAQDSFGRDVRSFTRPAVRSYRGGAGGFRLDWRLNSRHAIVARGDFARHREWSPDLGLDVLNGGGTRLDQRDFSGGVALASGWENSANEVRIGFRSAKRDWRPSALPASYLVGDGVGVGSSPALPGDFSRLTLDLAETFQLDMGSSKQHRLKLGVQYSRGSWEQDYAYGTTGVFSFGDLDAFSNHRGSFYVAETPSSHAHFTLTEAGLFGQMLWKLSPGLTALTGARYDRQIFPKQRFQPISGDPLFLSTFGLSNSRVPNDNKNVTPRLGLVWEGGPNQAWSATLGASRAYGQLSPARFAEAMVADGSLTARRGVGDLGAWPALPDTTLAPRTGQIVTLFSPNGKYRNPRTSKLDATLSRTLASTSGSVTRVNLSAGYHHTDFLLRRTDLNLLAGPTGSTQEGRQVFGTLQQEGGLVVAQPGSNRRFSGFDLVSALASTGFSNNYEVSLGVSREAETGLSFSASYMWSQTRDNWLQSWTGDPTDELSPFPLDKPGKEWAEGISDFDLPHRAVVLANWTTAGRVPLVLGARYRFRSGLPYTPGFRPGVDANADGSGRNDPAFLDAAVPGLTQVIGQNGCLKSQVGKFAERNSCREAANHALDLSASVGLPVRSLGGRVMVLLDLFNVVSTPTGVVDRALLLVDPAGTVTTDALGNVTLPLLANPRFGKLLSRRTDPRMVRLGLRVAY
ncbi:MAG: TonB-dependent receptor, partial [Gemmatimonadota bacterium]